MFRPRIAQVRKIFWEIACSLVPHVLIELSENFKRPCVSYTPPGRNPFYPHFAHIDVVALRQLRILPPPFDPGIRVGLFDVCCWGPCWSDRLLVSSTR